jgi:thymidylate synthase (FAD)
LKPQATEFKAIIGMNAHALLDWFSIRCCKRAQDEIRDLANKMLKLCKAAAPDLFINAGPNCKVLGYCPENEMQHKDCRGKVISKAEAMNLLREAGRKKISSQ